MKSEKSDISALEQTPGAAMEEVVEQKRAEAGQDYAGAVAKTDQDEIRLVRKLDFRIMPTLWAMYFLYVKPLLVVVAPYVLTACCIQKLSRPECNRARQAQ